MNTPAHLLIGAAVFGRPATTRIVGAAFIGAMLPDLSLYLMAGVSLIILQIPPEVVFRDLYFSDAWQMAFAIDNSFIVWFGLLGLAVWQRSTWAIALTGAALLHLVLDFPLHHDDGLHIFGRPRGGCLRVQSVTGIVITVHNGSRQLRVSWQ